MLGTARHRGEHGSGRAARSGRPCRLLHTVLGGILLAGLLVPVPLGAQQSDPAAATGGSDVGTDGVQTTDSDRTDAQSSAIRAPAPTSAPSTAHDRPATGEKSELAGATEDPAESWKLWESPAELDTWPNQQSSPIWVAGRVLLAVLLVIALVMLLLLLLRRYGIAGGASGIGAPRLQMLANLSLGQRRTIFLIRVDGVELLVASAGDGLRLLTELPGTRDALLAASGPGIGKKATAAAGTAADPPAGSGSFLATFRRALGGWSGGDDRDGEGNPGASLDRPSAGDQAIRRVDTFDDGSAAWGSRTMHPNR